MAFIFANHHISSCHSLIGWLFLRHVPAVVVALDAIRRNTPIKEAAVVALQLLPAAATPDKLILNNHVVPQECGRAPACGSRNIAQLNNSGSKLSASPPFLPFSLCDVPETQNSLVNRKGWKKTGIFSLKSGSFLSYGVRGKKNETSDRQGTIQRMDCFPVLLSLFPGSKVTHIFHIFQN